MVICKIFIFNNDVVFKKDVIFQSSFGELRFSLGGFSVAYF